MKRLILLLFAGALLLPGLSSAQVISQAYIPESGFYWNPGQPGRGYAIEVQDRLLFIAAYVYTEEADPSTREPLWFTAAGELVVGNVGAVTYSLSTELNFSEDGQCLGCTFIDPITTSTGRNITITFDTAFSAELVIDGEIIPIQRFWYTPSISNSTFAMQGQWTFVTDFTEVENTILPFEGDMLDIFDTVDDFTVSGIRSGTNIGAAGSVNTETNFYVVVVAETGAQCLAYYWNGVDFGTDSIIGLAERYTCGGNITGQGFPMHGRRIGDRNFVQLLNGVTSKNGSVKDVKAADRTQLKRPMHKTSGKPQLTNAQLAQINGTLRVLEAKLAITEDQ